MIKMKLRYSVDITDRIESGDGTLYDNAIVYYDDKLFYCIESNYIEEKFIGIDITNFINLEYRDVDMKTYWINCNQDFIERCDDTVLNKDLYYRQFFRHAVDYFDFDFDSTLEMFFKDFSFEKAEKCFIYSVESDEEESKYIITVEHNNSRYATLYIEVEEQYFQYGYGVKLNTVEILNDCVETISYSDLFLEDNEMVYSIGTEPIDGLNLKDLMESNDNVLYQILESIKTLYIK